MYSPATAEHQRLVGFLFRLLQGYCEAKSWGVLTSPAAVQILSDVVREPDLFILPPKEVPKAKGVPLKVHPVLIIEVVSPSTRTMDPLEKAEDYARAKVPEHWAVDLEARELVVHRLEGEGYRVERLASGKVESATIPGFWLEAGRLFQEPLSSAAECLRAVFR